MCVLLSYPARAFIRPSTPLRTDPLGAINPEIKYRCPDWVFCTTTLTCTGQGD
jgi:hypothetical protein